MSQIGLSIIRKIFNKIQFRRKICIVIQSGPKVGILYTIYCIPNFGPPCIFIPRSPHRNP